MHVAHIDAWSPDIFTLIRSLKTTPLSLFYFIYSIVFKTREHVEFPKEESSLWVLSDLHNLPSKFVVCEKTSILCRFYGFELIVTDNCIRVSSLI